jgi:hypothetical protein
MERRLISFHAAVFGSDRFVCLVIEPRKEGRPQCTIFHKNSNKEFYYAKGIISKDSVLCKIDKYTIYYDNDKAIQ